MYYQYLLTGDGACATHYWQLAYESARASSENSSVDNRVFESFNMMNGNNVWEDSFGLFIYSNASIVRGLRDAANLADLVGSNT